MPYLDPGHYDYLPITDRPELTWPGGARIAVWLAPNVEFYELMPPANPQKAAWPGEAPDVLGYSVRDYGNRAGFWRMLEVMDRFGVRGSMALNVALCDHHPEIIEAAAARGWEFLSHGIYNGRYMHGMSEAQERQVIEDAFGTVERATGQRLRGWLSPALTNTERTTHLLAEYGICYSCDFLHDDQPFPLKVRRGRLISVPYTMETNDGFAFRTFMMTAAQFAAVIKAQFDQLYAEGGRVMCLALHPFQIGQPYRIGALAEGLAHIAGHAGVWFATGAEIADWYYEHHYDAVVARLEGQLEEGAVSGLPGGYMDYPKRRPGMDHDRYDWAILPRRAAPRWPNGAHLAVWVVAPLTWFPLDLAPQGRPAPGAWSDPFPNFRDYTVRDYGNRVGAFRMMEVLDRHGVRATAPVNAAVCTRYPALVEAGLRRGWEFAGHGLDMGHLHAAGLEAAAEAEMVARALETVRAATGQTVAGWLSPGQSESLRTPELLAANGVAWVGDWANDDLPYAMRTAAGTLHALPCSTAANDTVAIWQSLASTAEFTRQAMDGFDWLHRESREGGCRVFTLVANGWVLGQPHRIRALDAILAHVTAREGVWLATGSEIVAGFVAQDVRPRAGEG